MQSCGICKVCSFDFSIPAQNTFCGGYEMKNSICRLFLFVCVIAALFILQNCAKNNFLGKKAIPLLIQEVDSADIQVPHPHDPNNPGSNPVKDGGFTLKPADELHPIFSAPLGFPIPSFSMGAVDADPSGLSVVYDWDGDGVENDLEVMSSPYVADYPRVVTRISTPITMELRKSETDTTENYVESVENTDTQQKIKKSMENTHYTQLNQKTTPYVTKESQSTDNADAYSYGSSNSNEVATSVSLSLPSQTGYSLTNTVSTDTKTSNSQNFSISNKFAQSTMSEKTVFEDVDYVDNLDKNAIEMTDEKIKNMSTNFRKSEKSKETYVIGENAGVIRGGLYIKNDTVNMPVRVSNVICTISFRTAGGAILPIKTFRLRNDDYSEFDQEVYGGEELGPYTIEITGLNTYEVKQALLNGYMPQITVVSYDMTRVDDSNYNPGVENLKIVEETAKARTALIKIVGTNTREIYRVAAFDVDVENGTVSPGISLKKALFNIYADKIGHGEQWRSDKNSHILTVADTGLKWKEGFTPGKDGAGEYAYSSNLKGNEWRLFQTYVKSYTDEYNQTHRMETIRRIGALKAYNPFDIMDNTSYNPNVFLEREQLTSMKYWIIIHNGRYFEGDLNDPIWAGERYEIICMDIRDFNDYFRTFTYTPVQSREYFSLNTGWNALNNSVDMTSNPYPRARCLGKIVKTDVVHLEIKLNESRFLFDGLGVEGKPVGEFNRIDSNGDPYAREWYKFNYTLQTGASTAQGIPGQFSHLVEGGFNNIKVMINDSDNAQSYEIAFKENKNNSATWKKVSITAEELKINNNEVFITSQTLDVNNHAIGNIPGTLLSTGGLEYRVTVTALGVLNGVPVSTYSMTNKKDEALAHVYNVDGSAAPGGINGFTFSAAAFANNWVYVRISDADYVEYDRITVLGPYNYDYNGNTAPLNDATAPVNYFTAHRGINKIQLSSPSVDLKKDGVYKILVNTYNTNGSRLAENEFQYVSLTYGKYAAQRVYKPRLSNKFFTMSAIDLEVNFNDGGGWYRLKLDSGDTCDIDDVGPRMIDCRFNSYVDYDMQKFHIFFKPPCGVYDDYSKYFAGNHDVFAGGREETDIYIRTVAEQRYRDTFWLRDQNAELFNEALNYFITPATILSYLMAADTNKIISDYWTGSDLTDASKIEATLSSNAVSSGSSYSNDMAIGIKGTDIANYFFSPVEYRKFDVRASLVEALPQQQNYVVDAPPFYASGGPSCIYVNNIDSQFSTYYGVYYKLVNPNHDPGEPLIGADENPLNWDSVRVDMNNKNNVNSLGLGRVTIPIPENAIGQYYIVAVIGYNMYGRSEPVYFDGFDGTVAKSGDTDNRSKVSSVYVYDGSAPTAEPTITAALDLLNKRQILVSDVQATGAIRYVIEWKESQEDWAVASSYDTYSTGVLMNGAVNLSINIHHGLPLREWKRYNVRARAVSLNNLNGPHGPSVNGLNISTGLDSSFEAGTLAFGDVHRNSNWFGNLLLQNTLPEGAARYRIDAIVQQYHSGGVIETPGITIDVPDTRTSSILMHDMTLRAYGVIGIICDAFCLPVTGITFDTTRVEADYTITVFNQDGDAISSSMFYDVTANPPAYE